MALLRVGVWVFLSLGVLSQLSRYGSNAARATSAIQEAAAAGLHVFHSLPRVFVLINHEWRVWLSPHNEKSTCGR